MAAAIWIRQPDCPRSKPGACIDEARVVVEPHVGLDGTDARDALPPRQAALAKAGESERRCKQTKTGLYSMHVESTGVVRGAIVSSVLPPVTWPGSGMRRGRRHVIAILFIAAFRRKQYNVAARHVWHDGRCRRRLGKGGPRHAPSWTLSAAG